MYDLLQIYVLYIIVFGHNYVYKLFYHDTELQGQIPEAASISIG